jgi:hypothetical protein
VGSEIDFEGGVRVLGVKEIEAVQRLIDMAEDLPDGDRWMLYTLQRRAEVTVASLFGPSSRYFDDLGRITFFPWVGADAGESAESLWESGKRDMLAIFHEMMEEVRAGTNTQGGVGGHKGESPSLKQVFLAHGLDQAMERTVIQTLDKLGLEPLFLYGRSRDGGTIAESFDGYADIPLAVVLLSEEDKDGACPEVVFELDLLLQRLGKDRVLILYKGGEVDRASDPASFRYVSYDDSGGWQFDLVKALKARGYQVDANRLL